MLWSQSPTLSVTCSKGILSIGSSEETLELGLGELAHRTEGRDMIDSIFFF